MAEVVDQMHMSEQLLLRELQTRFPEVPLEVVYAIMQKTLYNRERCIEALARECQNYQLQTALPSYMDATGEKWDREYRHQHSDSNESRASVSSINSGSTMSPAIAMKSSNSFPYIPAPNPVDHSTKPLHDPSPRSSLPLTIDIHGRATGFSNNCAAGQGGYFDPSRRLELHSIVSSASSGSVLLSPDKHYSQSKSIYGNHSPNAQVCRPQNVTSEVTYLIPGSGDSSATRSQSVWVQQPMYLSETRLNIQPPMHESGPPSGESSDVSRLGTNADLRSPNSYSALYMHPTQVWVKNQSARPATFVSSLSSSSESLSAQSFMNSDESKTAVRWQRQPFQNGMPLGPSSDDTSYLAALQICQTGNLDRLHNHYQETLRYRQKLCFEIGQLEAQLMSRLQNRSFTFPTADDIHKLQSENKQLQLEIQQLTRQIDLAGDVPLGITDPEEAQSFIRSNSMRRSTSRGSAAMSSLSISSPPSIEHRELPMSPSHHQEQRIFEERRLEELVDDDEGRWACVACTFLNHPALKNCECCEMPRLPCHR